MRLTTGVDVRARIAAIMLGDAPDISIGSISLKKHQSSAVMRIAAAIGEFGGALLCDEVGMGKTYVATAIAHAYSRVLIVAPATLMSMWRKALNMTGTRADLISFEKMSRVPATQRWPVYDFIIVDEAHHARNRATHRHAQLQQLTRVARVLLLSATPIHNHRNDMIALLTLFLGERASQLTEDELMRCIIRREHHQIEEEALIPDIRPIMQLDVPDRADIVDALMTLPPAIAVRDGGLAQALVGRGLVHQWASSEAALREALRKRVARATALVASLEAGTYPTARELRSWTFADGAIQLGFAEFLAAPTADSDSLLLCVRHHREALVQLLQAFHKEGLLDSHRGELVLRIRHNHRGVKIVAFAQYAATVGMLFRTLLKSGHVALLTARGASVAGGKMSRHDALARFAPEASGAKMPGSAEQIDLLLTTDLLSEGVNLQDAGVVVHLDLPWTAARMEQRVGRVARIGSTRSDVQPYVIAPPQSAARVLQSQAIIQRKWNVARSNVGSTRSPPIPARVHPASSTTSRTELLRTTLEGWRGKSPFDPCPSVACIESRCRGFLAAVTMRGQPRLLVDVSGEISTEVDVQLAACRFGTGPDIEMDDGDFARAITKLESFCETQRAATLAGTASSTLRRRRLLSRIDHAIEDAPPHLRASLLEFAMRARRVVASQHSGAVEAELDALAHSRLEGGEWLAAVTRLEPSAVYGTEGVSLRDRSTRADDPSFVVHAILLLRRRPVR